MEFPLIKSIDKLKCGNLQGSDSIGAEFLYKNTSSLIAHVLCKLYNKIFSTAVFPDIWRDSIIVPVYKSGPQDDSFKLLRNFFNQCYV
jgi:hypothetical protein